MLTPLPNALTDHRKIYSVVEFTRMIKITLENEIGAAWIEGEISNLSRPSSGHLYFTLKDAEANIKAVFFRGSQAGLKIELKDGLKIRIYGELTVYERQGQYQIIVRKVEPAGLGSLQEQFEKLKEKLSKEGLFDAARKKPIPMLPQHVGIVTSPTGAAIQDMLNILTRRFPNLHIVIVPAKVQGDGSAQEVADGIDLLNRRGGIDVMIIGRGGGSLEDLWCFNEEIVARAIARSKIPIISAVGHEIDFTISDFVADLRAPTPSAAAELVVGQKVALEEKLHLLNRHLGHALNSKFLDLKNRYTRLSRSYVFREPENLARHFTQRIDGCRIKLASELRRAFSKTQQRIDELSLNVQHRMDVCAKSCAHDIRRLDTQLRALSPAAVLERGYSITYAKDGSILRSFENVMKNEKIVTKLAKGALESTVEKTYGNEQ